MDKLTPSAIPLLYKREIEDAVVQVINVVPLSNGRAEITVSDGEYSMVLKLTTQASKIALSEVKLFNFVMVKHVQCNKINNENTFIAADIQVHSSGPGYQIGTPKTYEEVSMYSSGSRQHHMSSQSSQSSGSSYTPISALNAYNNRWTIKARITNKSNIRTWSNQKGDGKLFNIDLLDHEGGQIRATFFNVACDKFYPLLELNKVYVFSKGSVRPANKAFSRLANEYELTFDENAAIEPVSDDHTIKQQKFDNIVTLDKINSMTDISKDLVDIVAVVHEVKPSSVVVSRTKNKELVKREITITDKGLLSMDLTLWGDQAEKYNEEELKGNPVIAVKACRISDYNGRSLSTSFDSQIFVNPDFQEAVELRKWYNNEGIHANLQAVTRTAYAGNNTRKHFSDIDDEEIKSTNAVVYLNIRGTITHIRNNNDVKPWYTSCPGPDCAKKIVFDELNHSWFCDRCNKSYNQPLPRYILSFLCADATGSRWVTAFNKDAEVILGISAKELSDEIEGGNSTKFDQVIKDALFKTYELRVRAKHETSQDTSSIRVQVISATPVDYKKEINTMLKEIEAYSL